MSSCTGNCVQGRLCTCAPTTDRDYADKSWLHPEQRPDQFTGLEVVLLSLTVAFGIAFGIAIMHIQ